MVILLGARNYFDGIDTNPPLEEAIVLWACLLLGGVMVVSVLSAVILRLRGMSRVAIRPFTCASKVASLLIVMLVCVGEAIQLTGWFEHISEAGGTPDPWRLAVVLRDLGHRLFWVAGALGTLILATLLEWSARGPEQP